MEKRCAKCGQIKPLDVFYSDSRRPDGRQPYCKECKRTVDRRVYLRRTPEQTRRYRQVVAERSLDRRLALYDYLKKHPCVDCGEADPVVLELDHVSGDKVDNVTSMITNGASWCRIEQEIAKCEVRCANCHRRATARRAVSLRHVCSLVV